MLPNSVRLSDTGSAIRAAEHHRPTNGGAALRAAHFSRRRATTPNAGRARLLPSRDQSFEGTIIVKGTMAASHASGFARTPVCWIVQYKD